MGFKDRIAALRKDSGLSRENFGAKVGVSANTITNWEKGDNTPHANTIDNIASRLGVFSDWLSTGNGPKYLDRIPRTRDVQSDVQAIPPEKVGEITYSKEDGITVEMIGDIDRLDLVMKLLEPMIRSRLMSTPTLRASEARAEAFTFRFPVEVNEELWYFTVTAVGERVELGTKPDSLVLLKKEDLPAKSE